MEGCESLRSCREVKAALLEGMRLEAKEREAGKLERMEVAEEEVGKEERKLGSGGFVNWCEVGSRCIGTCSWRYEKLSTGQPKQGVTILILILT